MVGKVAISVDLRTYFESALGVSDPSTPEYPDAGVKPVHQDCPENGSLRHRLVLKMGSEKENSSFKTI